MTFEIRPATPADGRAIAEVHKETWAATYTPWIPDVIDGYDLERSAENWARTAHGRAAATSRSPRRTATCSAFAVSGPARGDGVDGRR